MDAAFIKKYAQKYKIARNNLMVIAVFTSINLLLTFFDIDFYMLFSAIGPQVVHGFFSGLAAGTGFDGLAVIGIILAVLIIGLYFICWFLSKKYRAFMLVALIFYSLDMLLFLLIAAIEFDASFSLDIVFHLWVLYYLIIGVVAWAKLRGADDTLVDAAMQERTVQQGHQAESASPNGILAESTPLRADEQHGRVLVSAEYHGLKIYLKRVAGATELIINGHVYDEFIGRLEPNDCLTATFQNNRIVGMNVPQKSQMQIYVNDVLVAKKFNLF